MVPKKFSDNHRINTLIENILDELCPFLEEQANEISQLTAIGKALGAGQDITVLLEMILSIAMRFTKADGGTLYLVNSDTRNLEFHVIHNTTLKLRQSGNRIELPNVPLYHENLTPNLSNVSSYVFHTGRVVNIKDVYRTKKFHFDGTKKFDTALGYRSKSMLVIPMKNHQDDIIGILQLINAKDIASSRIIAFSSDSQEKASALASQASVILTQQMLIYEMKELFEAFIEAIAVSIDAKSKHTGGHIQRVTQLSLMIAEKINQDITVFKDQMLSADQINELRIAALMHDTGKITTPDHIVGKSSRLETVCNRIDLVKTRWELFKTNHKLIAAQKKLALLEADPAKDKILQQIDSACEEHIHNLEKDLDFIIAINANKALLKPDELKRLEKISTKSFSINGKAISCLTPDEFENLSIPKGTLTLKEREVINNHAHLTEKILKKLPWPKNLANIPSIAGAHHEKLDGTGYPLGLDKNDLNLQARILAIADIFEALCAPDRPYKNPMSLSQTKEILYQMGEKGALDKDIIHIFFKSETHLDYARQYLCASQIDI
ncbi:MAG: HD domain-containing protein [Proteobacteria bacterium]|nr:HD domain-containing protein [Pseudomonadota bacterium]MBU1389118.1 HD domain-containing protein [Pseudomonadota bacterium]MBU1543342.1 HD domain-containing protein [Pseudomonadota bacterium]MBU2479821.1 HD domain-containing protein [Pseudomonadota bacterium]